MRIRIIILAIVLNLAFAFASQGEVAESDFGKTRDGTAVRLFTITNKSGASMKVMTYGAAVVSLNMPDRSGKLADIVLGFDSIEGYQRSNPFFGAIVGRYANRIAGATFSLEGTPYKLSANNGRNTLHGGRVGFDKVSWSGAQVDDQTVGFTYLSKDGDQGFPGNLTAHVLYSLSDANEMKIEYAATTDQETVVNLAHHSYFNLAGAGNGDILDHELMIDADQFTPTDHGGIPLDKMEDVAGTPFDFRQSRKIGDRIAINDPQIHAGNGYDHNFVLTAKDGVRLAASVYEPVSGRVLDIFSDQPGIQFYSGNGLDGAITGKDGKVYPKHAAFCLEPQHFPDSPNHPEYPGTELKPGETYHTVTLYKFSAR